MRVALINPHWTFEGSIYFGCRDPHLPLEHGYTKALLEAHGHEVLLIDAHLLELGLDEVRAELRAFGPEMTVVTHGADLSVLALRAARAARAASRRWRQFGMSPACSWRSVRTARRRPLPCSRSSASTSS